PEFRMVLYYAAFLRGDSAALARESEAAKQDADVGDWASHAESCFLAWSGHLKEAREKSRQAVQVARQSPHKSERAAAFLAGAAVREAFFGNVQEAKRYADTALGISKARDVMYGAALAQALVGETAESEKL